MINKIITVSIFNELLKFQNLNTTVCHVLNNRVVITLFITWISSTTELEGGQNFPHSLGGGN